MRFIFIFCFILSSLSLFSQDTVYAREVIQFLTSKKCYGRGYVNNGLKTAEKYIVSELKKQSVASLFNDKFTQSFIHSVNTFPKQCFVSINGKKLKPGVDFILNPASKGVKGKFLLTKIDSLQYSGKNDYGAVSLFHKRKLTYSVANATSMSCDIELDKNKIFYEAKEIELNVKNKLIPNFESKNIGCFIEGKSNSDSLIIFSAHYDHLGGMGNSTFFPGANDNASGVSVILNLIKFYKLYPPQYKTIFLFFAGEEAGLLGSKFFVEHSPLDLKKIKFLVNLDLLGTGDDGIMVVNGSIHAKEFDLMNKINSEKHLVKEIKKRGKAANSDHYWFTEVGVPCFFIYTTGGIKAYHDVFDVEKTLPLTDYVDVFKLITSFVQEIGKPIMN